MTDLNNFTLKGRPLFLPKNYVSLIVKVDTSRIIYSNQKTQQDKGMVNMVNTRCNSKPNFRNIPFRKGFIISKVLYLKCFIFSKRTHLFHKDILHMLFRKFLLVQTPPCKLSNKKVLSCQHFIFHGPVFPICHHYSKSFVLNHLRNIHIHSSRSQVALFVFSRIFTFFIST